MKSTLQGRMFQKIQEITENSQMKLHTIPKKGVPGLFLEAAMTLGALHQCRKEVL
jgi:mevalonate pyrophosphate decarboxylase